MSAAYKVRKLRKPDTPKGDYDASSIAIPKEIVELLDENLPNDVRFTVELTDEGILYRPVITPATAKASEKLPAWLEGVGAKDAKSQGKGSAAASAKS